jgi:DNA-binding NarL/FixJ family response regulator
METQASGTQPDAARIVIGGDQALIRAALRLLVESEPGLTVVRECENRPEALAAASGATADLILLDFDLCCKSEGHLEQIGPLLRAANGTPVLILTAANDYRAAHVAFEHGAVGFVMKDRPPEVLYRAIRAATAGEAWLERSAFVAVFRSASQEINNGSGDGGEPQLTRREREIIDLVLLGMQNKAIADRLFIAETTVRHHLTSIFDKLNVGNRFELMRRVFNGLPDLREEAVAR